MRLPWLYVLLDLRAGDDGTELARRMGLLIELGVSLFQLRAKQATARELEPLARALAGRCRRGGARLIVNDRVDVALAAGAHGVHLGSQDLPVAAARRLAPSDFIVGATVRSAGGAERASRAGADYVALGPVALSGTKRVPARPRTAAEIGATVRAMHARCPPMPVVAVGGITPERAARLRRLGVDTLAVAAALEDPRTLAGVVAAFATAAANGGPVPCTGRP